MPGALANHLWQSTVFAIAAAVLALAFRRNRAAVRFWIWFAASAKFLVPVSLLIALGSRVELSIPQRHAAPAAVSIAVVEIAEPFVLPVAPAPYARDWSTPVLLTFWACGFAGIVLMRLRGWLRLRALLRVSTPLRLALPVEVRSVPGLLEPGVAGFFRPILLLPAGILDRLSPEQLNAVLAHELCHVRRRDNLTSALHMLVEAVFWFHPLVWWIGAHLVEERERACDEEVLERGNQPTVYAESILTVCKNYLESPLPCISGVTGADLKSRIRAILSGRAATELSRARKVALVAAAAAAVAAPVLVGLLHAQPAGQAKTPVPPFDAVSVKPCKDEPGRRRANVDVSPGRLSTGCNILVDDNNLGLIQRAYVRFAGGRTHSFGIVPIKGGPDWIRSELYEINAKAEGAPSREMMQGPMMQAVLEDRFKLKVHRETAQGPVYELTVAKASPKLQPFQEGSCVAMPLTMPMPTPPPGQRFCRSPMIAPRQLNTEGGTLEEFCQLLSLVTRRPVIDKTGLTGRFNIHVDFTPDDIVPGMGGLAVPVGTPPEQGPPNLFTALQEQLGLKLVSARGPVEFLMIDHIERPSEN